VYLAEMNGEEKPSVVISDGSNKYIDWTISKVILFVAY